MTLQQLEDQRQQICVMMIEAEGRELRELEQNLSWVEELIRELEVENEQES